jgi:hypothetical protein
MRLLACLLLAGCADLFCEDDPCDADPAPPVRGTPADFAPPAGEGWSVAAPAPCAEGHVVVVSGQGTRRFGDDLAPPDFRPDLPGTSVNSSGFGFWCGVGGAVGPFVETDDWTAVADLASRLGDALAAEDLGEDAAVIVRERLVVCPQSACGY